MVLKKKMEKGMGKKRGLLVFMLWVIFIVMVGGIVFVSVQNGEESKDLGKQMILQIANARNASSEDDVAGITYLIRQSARAIAFLLVGMVGTLAVYVSFNKWNWFIKTGITVCILAFIACFTEKLKIYIPSRHYRYEEMMISLAAVAAGFLIVSLLTLLGKALKGLSRLLTTSHSL